MTSRRNVATGWCQALTLPSSAAPPTMSSTAARKRSLVPPSRSRRIACTMRSDQSRGSDGCGAGPCAAMARAQAA